MASDLTLVKLLTEAEQRHQGDVQVVVHADAAVDVRAA